MQLHQLQELVRRAVSGEADDRELADIASQMVASSPRMSGAEHLQIYRNAVLATMLRAVGDIYPVCSKLVGENFFNAMARAFVRSSPSVSPDLADYGAEFPDFVAAFEPAASLPYLPDVARLEWSWHRAFHGPDEPGIDTAALQRVSGPQLATVVFRLPGDAALLRSEFPVHRIWQVNQDDWQGEPEVSLDEGGVALLIWRRGSEMRIDPLSTAQWQLLRGVQRGLPFGRLADNNELSNIETLLPECVQTGWIAGFELASRDGE